MRYTLEEMQKIKKLYHNMPWRIAKKHLCDVKKLIHGLDLKEGDLIFTCRGWNEIISRIEPEWRRIPSRNIKDVGKGFHVIDFNIMTTNGGSHSLINCCLFPIKTYQEIMDYWNRCVVLEEHRNWYGEDYKAQFEKTSVYRITQALKTGKEVFRPDGTILPEFD